MIRLDEIDNILAHGFHFLDVRTHAKAFICTHQQPHTCSHIHGQSKCQKIEDVIAVTSFNPYLWVGLLQGQVGAVQCSSCGPRVRKE